MPVDIAIRQLFSSFVNRLRNSGHGPPLIRVDFPIIELDGSRNGVEGLWCIRRGDSLFEIDNIPFAVREVSLGYLVECHWNGNSWVFHKVIKKSCYCCARVYAESSIDLNLWKCIIENLDIKYEFASGQRVGVAAVPTDMMTLVERISELDEVLVEVTATVGE